MGRDVTPDIPVVITGAGGRIGTLLRQIWGRRPPPGLRPIWLGRGPGMDLAWDMLAEAPPIWPEGAVVLHLAGVTRGTPADLAQNPAMIAPVLAACAENRAAALLFASTAAVYPPGPDAAQEDGPLAPPNAYGASKLQAEALLEGASVPVSILRFGNVAGAESLLSPRPDPVVLDPVPGRAGGPVRSWIGPVTLANTLAHLCRNAQNLPDVVNVVQSPALPMADLLQACGCTWRYGPENPGVVPAVILSNARLSGLMTLPQATPDAIAAEVREARS